MTRKVLVVDDDAAFREIVVAVLTRAGFAIGTADSGRQAIATMLRARDERDPFGVVFLDLEMPGLDGLQTADMLRGIDPELRVIVCTGSEIGVDALAAGSLRDALVLKKPIDSIELVHAAFAASSARAIAGEARERAAELDRRLTEQLSWRTRMDLEMSHDQRLETVGQLAAGIAHEINTPIQYIGDNVQFLRDAMDDLVATSSGERPVVPNDLAYIRAELPAALDAIQHGIRRVSNIVHAMKELSYRGTRKLGPADLNRAIEHALELAHNSYRYVSKLDKQLGDIPNVRCHAVEIGQVVLNLLINAAHAMEERRARGDGKLTVISRLDGDHVVISVSDNGTGIPESARERIFDRYFTTKDAGRNSGQGLAISRSIVVRHGGTMRFDTEVDVGTTFYVRLPIAGPAEDPA